MQPEEYFKEVQRVILHSKPEWKLRRFITLYLFDYSKLLMYLDLNPQRWPEGSIKNHKIVNDFFSDTVKSASYESYFEDEHGIDEIAEIHEQFPLIYDADSSQHSAIIDAINGDDLIVEGPPGTGKSQTITNLIAAAMAQGKLVLFVAEKMAALEVVKDRLDKADLGDFCLELHSKKTQKRKIAEDLAIRLKKIRSFPPPYQLEDQLNRFESLKSKLNKYAININKKWKNTGKTIGEILQAATRYSNELNRDLTELTVAELDTELITEEYLSETLDDLKEYQAVFNSILQQLSGSNDIHEYPWYGVKNLELQPFESQDLITALNSWTDVLVKLKNCLNETVLDSVHTDLSTLKTLKQIHFFIDSVQNMPDLDGNERFDVIQVLDNERLSELQSHISNYDQLLSGRDQIAKDFSEEICNDTPQFIALQKNLQKIFDLGISDTISLEEVSSTWNHFRSLNSKFEKIKDVINSLENVVSGELKGRINSSYNGFKILVKISETMNRLNPSSLKYRTEALEDDEIDQPLEKFHETLEKLLPLRKIVQTHFRLENIPPSHELEDHLNVLESSTIFSWFNSEWRYARKSILSLAVRPGLKIHTLKNKLGDLLDYRTLLEGLENYQKVKDALGEHYKGLDTCSMEILELRKWYKEVQNSFGVGFAPDAKIGQAVIALEKDILKGLHTYEKVGLSVQLKEILNDIDQLRSHFPNIELLNDNNYPFFQEGNILTQTEKYLNSHLSFILEHCKSTDKNLNELRALAQAGLELNDSIISFEENRLEVSLFGEDYRLNLLNPNVTQRRCSVIKSTVRLGDYLKNTLHDLQVFADLRRQCSPKFFELLFSKSARIQSFLAEEEPLRKRFSEIAGMEIQEDNLANLIDKNKFRLRNKDYLINWLNYIGIRDSFLTSPFKNIIVAIENIRLDVKKIDVAFWASIYGYLAKEIFREEQWIKSFNGASHEEVRRQFCEYDRKILELQRQKIASKVNQNTIPPGVRGAKARDYTELALIKKESNKKTRHIPIRQLIKRAGKALVALKPCFMMSPLSVAQYLEPGIIEFDLVVMDEASQIKPEDALGAIARGKQIVIVGDPKQLPPTSFFDKTNFDIEDEDQTIIEESESILEAMLSNCKTRRLRWHYRSRHEDLIKFSNYKFYDGDLVVFPSPHSKSPEFGIKFTHVPKGCFVKQRNVEEAEITAQAVRNHFLSNPKETLGVVAMNQQQSEQIKRSIEELTKQDPLFRKTHEANSSNAEPLFIKNLENVQGDERDVIYISCTYGPMEPGGRIAQRFGPINGKDGWRRLNVLFTRSKKRMHVFSTMKAEDIILTGSSGRGVVALKNFLAFARTGHIEQAVITDKEPDSDFEIDVMNRLANHGYQCKPQVGVAGFYIDLSVIDPEMPGRYLMGVECDGATYHSSKSARDRDRLRQEILEGLGWTIRRIWSTDWFKNPEATLILILDELKKLQKQNYRIPKTIEKVPLSIGQDNELDRYRSEEEAIDNIIETIDSVQESIKDYSHSSLGLWEKLHNYHEKVVRDKYPDTPIEKKLLHPLIIDELTKVQPTSKWEFEEKIPKYLKEDIRVEEKREFLQPILDIILLHQGSNPENSEEVAV